MDDCSQSPGQSRNGLTVSTIQSEYNRLRGLIGKQQTEILGTLSQRDLDRFALAAGSADSEVAHPLLLSSLVSWTGGPAESTLAADGLHPAVRHGITDKLRLMGAGQDVSFHGPVRPGVEVTVHTSFVDVQIKEGRSGEMLIAVVVRQFVDADGRALVTSRESVIGR